MITFQSSLTTNQWADWHLDFSKRENAFYKGLCQLKVNAPFTVGSTHFESKKWFVCIRLLRSTFDSCSNTALCIGDVSHKVLTLYQGQRWRRFCQVTSLLVSENLAACARGDRACKVKRCKCSHCAGICTPQVGSMSSWQTRKNLWMDCRRSCTGVSVRGLCQHVRYLHF